MTENRAILEIKYRIDTATQAVGAGIDGKAYEDLEIAIQALEKVQAFEAIGTIEEFKALKHQDHDCIIKHLSGECSYKETGCSDCKSKWKIKGLLEKNEPKKPIFGISFFKCPSCESGDVEEIYETGGSNKHNYCPSCGQKLDWQGREKI